jgi:alpha-beta hydrolase superfamily lysophospholipase
MKTCSILLMLTCAPSILNCGAKPAMHPAASVSTEQTFNGDGLDLSGTFLMPRNHEGPVPAMLLLPGSGPTDRDGNSGNGMQVPKTDLLKQVAEYLAAHGVATLRFDKRAMLRYQSSWPKSPTELSKFFSYEHFVNDATAAYMTLRTEPSVDVKRVGILGHSEGGLFAMQIASNSAKTGTSPWKIILMSAAGRSLDTVIHEQLAAQLKAASASPADTNHFLSWWDAAATAIAHDKPLPPNQPPQLAPLVNPTVMDLMKAYITVDPTKLLANTSEPILILNGGDDAQVSPTKDAGRLELAAKARPAPATVELKIIPHLSHNYKSTLPEGHDGFTGPVSPEALDAIGTFLTTH